jgi:hypothetical protein
LKTTVPAKPPFPPKAEAAGAAPKPPNPPKAEVAGDAPKPPCPPKAEAAGAAVLSDPPKPPYPPNAEVAGAAPDEKTPRPPKAEVAGAAAVLTDPPNSPNPPAADPPYPGAVPNEELLEAYLLVEAEVLDVLPALPVLPVDMPGPGVSRRLGSCRARATRAASYDSNDTMTMIPAKPAHPHA